MIQVYDGFSADYTHNGVAVLFPMSCSVTEQAGASYELDMEYPLADEKWKLLTTGNVIRVPVPATDTETAQAGTAKNVYRAVSAGATMYSSQSVSQRVTYVQWTPRSYSVGSRVTHQGKNYRLIKSLQVDELFPPDSELSHGKWARISNMTSGASILYRFSAYEEFILLQDMGNGWYRGRTRGGIEGYIKANEAEFYVQEILHDVAPRTLRDQLFRIYETEVVTERNTVRVRGRHVSYDLTGVLLGDCDINNRTPTAAISAVHDAMLQQIETTIATNLTTADGNFTGNLSQKNVVFALLDPDNGIVPYYRARLVRDNWDFFIFKNDNKDRGFTIEYGKNLKGVTWKRNSENVITRIMPVAQTADGADFFLDGTRYIDSPYIDIYPTINMERLEVSAKVGGDNGSGGTWTEATLRAHMRELANNRFNVDHCDLVPYEVKVDFIRLGDTEEFKQYKNMDKLFLYDTVSVLHTPIGLNDALVVTQYKWDALNGRFLEITLSNSYDYGFGKISGFQLSGGSVTAGKIAPQAVGTAQLQRASINYALINDATIERLKSDAITATTAYIQNLIAQGITTDALYASIATISKASLNDADITWANIANLTATVAQIAETEIGNATIQTAQIQGLNAAVAAIAQAEISSATIQAAQIADLESAVATIVSAQIAVASIGFAQIKDAVAQNLITKDAVADKYFIQKLQVQNLQVISQTVDNLVVKASNGNYYTLSVDGNGAVTAQQTTVTASEIASGVTQDGQRSIIETDLLASELTATNIKGANALIDKIAARRINVDSLFAREAFIGKLLTTDISGNGYLQLMVDGKIDDMVIGGRNYLRNSGDLNYKDYRIQYLSGDPAAGYAVVGETAL